MKKYLSIAAIALIIVTLGVISYYYFVFDKVDQDGNKVSFREFLPFGRSGGDVVDDGGEWTEATSTETFGDIGTSDRDWLFRIADKPVAGYTAYETASGTVARYMDRATGNLFDYEMPTGREKRVTNTTLPRIREVVWHPNARSLVARSLKEDDETIDSFFATVTSTSTATSTDPDEPASLVGTSLPPGIDGMVALGATGKIFTLDVYPGGAVGTVSGFGGDGAAAAFRSDMREWLAQSVGSTTVALTMKASNDSEGYLYLLDTKTQRLTKLLGGIPGLTTLVSPDSKYVLYSKNEKGGFVLYLYDVANKKSVATNLPTFPEKCVWQGDSSGAYCAVAEKKLSSDSLDAWYQGRLSLGSDLWRIESKSGAIEPTFEIRGEGKPSDAIELSLNKDGTFLMFVDKPTRHLWALDLTESDEYYEEAPE